MWTEHFIQNTILFLSLLHTTLMWHTLQSHIWNTTRQSTKITKTLVLAKLTVNWLGRIFSYFYGTSKIHYCANKTPPHSEPEDLNPNSHIFLIYFLCQHILLMYLIHILTPTSSKSILIYILPVFFCQDYWLTLRKHFCLFRMCYTLCP
jgi:hypothetical protein